MRLETGEGMHLALEQCFVSVYNTAGVQKGNTVIIETKPGYVIEPEVVLAHGMTGFVASVRDTRNLEPIPVGGDVFWELPPSFPRDIEARLPDGRRLRAVLIEGRRLGFDEVLPSGTEIFRSNASLPMWVVR
jgi:hypothetical protein